MIVNEEVWSGWLLCPGGRWCRVVRETSFVRCWSRLLLVRPVHRPRAYVVLKNHLPQVTKSAARRALSGRRS